MADFDSKFDAVFIAARRASAPILVVNTPDQHATLRRIVQLNAESVLKPLLGSAVVVHDVGHGLYAAAQGHEPSVRAVASMNLQPPKDKVIHAVLEAAEKVDSLPPNSVLVIYNAHLHFKESGYLPTVQRISNLRDRFKASSRMLVLMTIDGWPVPPELDGDVISVSVPLPTRDVLANLVDRQWQNRNNALRAKADRKNKGKDVEDFVDEPLPGDVRARAVDALGGLRQFLSEQLLVLSLDKKGQFDIDSLWREKKRAINQTPGLTVFDGQDGFHALGGLSNIKTFYGRYLNGPYRPSVVVLIDESEKDLAGAQGDNTGVSQAQHKAMLTFMQDNPNVRGIIHAGIPGSGKTALGKAIGAEIGVPVILLNLGDMKGKHVGESEAATSLAFKTILEIAAQGNVLIVATANDLHTLSPELKSRFSSGTFFFDLPTREEKDIIWDIWLAKKGLDPSQPRPDDMGWVGREIEACCNQAVALGLPLVEASQYIVPGFVANRQSIDDRRRAADGKLISASYPGKFDMNRRDDVTDGARMVHVGDD